MLAMFRSNHAFMGIMSAPLLSGCVTPSQEISSKMGAKWYNKEIKDFFLQHGPPLSEFNVNENKKIYNFVSKKGFTHIMSAGVVETGCFIKITAVKGYITKMKSAMEGVIFV